MPVYEYQCVDCGRSFEELVRQMRDPQELVCPHCGSRRIERQLSVFAARQAQVEGRCCDACPQRSPNTPCCPYRPDVGGGCPG